MNYPDELDIAQLKILPQSLEAEQSVIGGLLISGAHFDSVSEIVGAEDFYHPQHRHVFTAMTGLAADNKPVDLTTVAAALSAAGDLDRIGGLIYLAEMARSTPSTSNIRAYASVVRERAVLRQLIIVGQEIAESGFEPEGKKSIELIDQAQAAVIALGDRDMGVMRTNNQVLREVVDDIDRLYNSDDTLTGISTGFAALDARTDGLQRGDLIILAARPSMGKTTLAMNIVEHNILAGNAVMVFSMEMTHAQLTKRSIASIGEIPFSEVRTGKLQSENWAKLSAAVSLLKDKPLHIDDRPALTIPQIRASARRIHKQAPLSLIVIDYLQLARAKAESRVMEVTQISQGLKALAKELNIPVLALSQLSRAVEQRSDKRPGNADLRDSGAIEQDADVIWFIYRDEVYNEETKWKGAAEILNTKQRNGPIGMDILATRLDQCRFENLSREWIRPIDEPKQQRRGGFDDK